MKIESGTFLTEDKSNDFRRARPAQIKTTLRIPPAKSASYTELGYRLHEFTIPIGGLIDSVNLAAQNLDVTLFTFHALVSLLQVQ